VDCINFKTHCLNIHNICDPGAETLHTQTGWSTWLIVCLPHPWSSYTGYTLVSNTGSAVIDHSQ